MSRKWLYWLSIIVLFRIMAGKWTLWFGAVHAVAETVVLQPTINGFKEQVRILPEACPDYASYAAHIHYPLSEGKLALPYQRPAEPCRTFVSPAVERVINDMTARIADKDLARLFENAFPNTLDTTVAWHDNGQTESDADGETAAELVLGKWEGAQSFVVTGDIRAEWLRDSTNQLLQYQALAKVDPKIHTLILGAINTQTEYVIQSPYCNAFQPPGPSKVPKTINGQSDSVTPLYEPRFVFECKYELDSLALTCRWQILFTIRVKALISSHHDGIQH